MDIRSIIEQAFEQRAQLSPNACPLDVREAVNTVLEGLNTNKYRVAEPINGTWQTHQWIKKAVLLSFSITPNQLMSPCYFDKIPLKYDEYSAEAFTQDGVRIVPGAIVRHGSYIGHKTILMPCFVNIGAHIGQGSMIDTWATVGSCAQIGKQVHLSGGAGIGGVLEPLQANPTIIEDNCFIGARAEVVEGVIVKKNSVIGMGVYLSQSTKIYNRITGEISYGCIPEGSVVVSGSLPSEDGKYSLYCAIIVKQVDEKTRMKTSINELLR